MPAKYVPPSIAETAFNCPHCGALAKQFWYSAHAEPLKSKKPSVWGKQDLERYDFKVFEEEERRQSIKDFLTKAVSGRPFLEKGSTYIDWSVVNVHIAKCFNCSDVSLWIYDRLIWPQGYDAPFPNPDLPDDVRADYEEAGLVLNISPRSSAALLRQAVQRLLKHTNEVGENHRRYSSFG